MSLCHWQSLRFAFKPHGRVLHHLKVDCLGFIRFFLYFLIDRKTFPHFPKIGRNSTQNQNGGTRHACIHSIWRSTLRFQVHAAFRVAHVLVLTLQGHGNLNRCTGRRPQIAGRQSVWQVKGIRARGRAGVIVAIDRCQVGTRVNDGITCDRGRNKMWNVRLRVHLVGCGCYPIWSKYWK